jgi:hypothetical protein
LDQKRRYEALNRGQGNRRKEAQRKKKAVADGGENENGKRKSRRKADQMSRRRSDGRREKDTLESAASCRPGYKALGHFAGGDLFARWERWHWRDWAPAGASLRVRRAQGN